MASPRKTSSSWPAGAKALLIALAAIGVTLSIALSKRTGVARCPAGLMASAARCCPAGQKVQVSHSGCVGAATSCAVSQRLDAGACILEHGRIAIAGGVVRLTPNDWQAEGEFQARTIQVSDFELDRTEVTLGQWARCASLGECRALASLEPGLPVASVTPTEAEAYCRTQGGRLPTSDEWIFAASGKQARRFPWGQTGLVCRRAAFGLEMGPCAIGATGPELAGSRPDGATPDGLLDMAGNVAEFTRGAHGIEVRGGSFRTAVAAGLKVWSARRPAGVAFLQDPAVGFRCAYDASPSASEQRLQDVVPK